MQECFQTFLLVQSRREVFMESYELVVPIEKMGLGKFQNRAQRVLEAASTHGRISPRAIASFIPREVTRDRERFSVVITLVYAFLASRQVIVTPDSQAVSDYEQEATILEKERTKFRKRSSNNTSTSRDNFTFKEVPEDLSFLDDDQLFGYTVPSSYFIKLKWIPLLTQEQEQELGKGILAGDIYARDKLVEHNLRLVVWVARRYSGYCEMELDDLVQEGNIGLITAAEKYNCEVGRFTTYAIWWIRQAITRAIADKQSNIRVPVHAREFESKVRRTFRTLEGELNREPTIEEIADRISISSEKVAWILGATTAAKTISLDAEVQDHSSKVEEGSSLGALLSDACTIGPDLYTEAQEELAFARERVSELLNTITTKLDLSERNRSIFKDFYGFDRSGKRKTFERVGLQFQLTRERVRQIIASIWHKTSEQGLDMDHKLLRAEMSRIVELEKFVTAAVAESD